MSEADKSALDKAEALVRRVLERLGSAIDEKVSNRDEPTLSTRRLGEINSLLENAIESNLRRAEGSNARVAPNRIKIVFSYEERSKLSAPYVEALVREMQLSASEFIADRRYQTLGPVAVEAESDLFGTTTSVKAAFEG